MKWYDKPHSLRNRETAVKLLKFIDEEETYKYITDADEQKFDSLFFNYWKPYDPTPDDSYNELMDEYYKRADYAAMNFSSISGKPGLESDRGKIYIKFGKPVNIERTSNENGKMIEIWEYANQKKFSFIDEKGTGEFNLMNG
ncbi:MAG: GWxTD domain-containing protein [Ignavibacteriales bacterium]|nr:MAG: GWxTD domain-containing protein [Ignavibacteriales bacterium]